MHSHLLRQGPRKKGENKLITQEVKKKILLSLPKKGGNPFVVGKKRGKGKNRKEGGEELFGPFWGERRKGGSKEKIHLLTPRAERGGKTKTKGGGEKRKKGT